MTCWRRLRDWHEAGGGWDRLHQVLLTALHRAGKLDWSRAVIVGPHHRARRGGPKRARRLDPMDRVIELGDASVPFRFDVHALIYSDDAVGLERALHQEFEPQRVNRVNARREFFHVTPSQVRDALTRHAGQHLLEFHEQPDAPEWRASVAAGRR
ncbi:GIY-YIG nuclease family protein [Streptomyces sp. NPDC007903]|uniref:GIY-YIG nuclease family protein n=1 Tax=Streptomyces sp. NPDC007903 TaxID=3364786 RepID=UPI0036F09EC8